MSLVLNPLTFPLHGLRLIEASAGTGKTYTITSLYLRLLLGHGDQETAAIRPLAVDEILVVTFTDAATQELKDRIRLKIKEARKAFEAYQRSETMPDDGYLAQLILDAVDVADSAAILKMAERQMDEAAIFTINGFCMRMLQQHAFESGSLFNVSLCEDDRELKYAAVKDYWRQQFYPLSKPLVSQVLDVWPSPEAVLSDVGRWLSDKPLRFTRTVELEDISRAHEQNLRTIDEFKALLREKLGEQVAAMADDVANKQLDGRSFSKSNLPKWANEVEAWASSDTQNYYVPASLMHFGLTKLDDKTKGDLTASRAFAEKIQAFADQPPELKSALKQHAIRICRALYQQRKQQQGVLTFDDQISAMANALIAGDSAQSGSAGQLFAEKLRKQFPVALVDEFQDTDESQYQIFDRIYGNSHHERVSNMASDLTSDSATGLFMIGDPKQAIYAFRGGDIFTYMKARRQVSQHYTLSTNWRSSRAMVERVNGVFESAESPFIYDSEIPFEAVQSNPNSEYVFWDIEGQVQPAMTFWQPSNDQASGAKRLTKDSDYLSLMASSTANEIARLLSLADSGDLTLHNNAQKSTLQPNDIAVLVRGFSQAQQVKAALAERGIASVYSSDKNSVYEQPEAQAILRILKAAFTPEHERLIKAAIGTDIFGWTAAELNKLNEDELAWEQLVFQFKVFQQRWKKQGVLPALHQLMADHQLAVKLKRLVNGERRLTDFLHLCELLQNQSKQVESQYALISWLEDRIHNPNQSAKEQQLRLESEANLVKIVTYHKSKGLEYKVVFAPFVSYFFPNKQGNRIFSIHDDAGNALVDVSQQFVSEAEKERLAEDVRLLYVTLTRSVYACYLGLPGTKPTSAKNDKLKLCPEYFPQTGLGWLASQGEALDPNAIDQLANKWISAVSVSGNESLTLDACVSAPNDCYTEYHAMPSASLALTLGHFDRSLDRNWWITSYSRLVSEGHGHGMRYSPDFSELMQQIEQSNYDASIENKDDDNKDEASALSDLPVLPKTESASECYDISTFPKGADAGTFLHTLFEEVVYEQCDTSESRALIQTLFEQSSLYQTCIEQMLPKFQQLRLTDEALTSQRSEIVSQWLGVLNEMVINVLSQPLHQWSSIGNPHSGNEALSGINVDDANAERAIPDKTVPVLRDTRQEQRLVELEFLLPLANLDATKVNAIIQQDPLTAKAKHPLSFGDVQGMLKGFIDLTFEFDGKFYVLDWKSNYLGDHSACYTQQAMATAMIEHRYDFQYQLYVLALHRYLQARIIDYDYDTHIGGAYYVFLRGIRSSSEASNFVDNNTSAESSESESHGVYFTKPDRTLIEGLDGLFRGDTALPVVSPSSQNTDKETDSQLDTYGDQGELF